MRANWEQLYPRLMHHAVGLLFHKDGKPERLLMTPISKQKYKFLSRLTPSKSKVEENTKLRQITKSREILTVLIKCLVTMQILSTKKSR